MSKQKTWAQKKEQLVALLLSQGGLVTWDDGTRNYGAYRGVGRKAVEKIWVFDPRKGLLLARESDHSWWGSEPNNYGGNFPGGSVEVDKTDPAVELPYGQEVVELYYEAHCCHNNIDNVYHCGVRLATFRENGWSAGKVDVYISETQFREIFTELEKQTIALVPDWAAMVGHPLLQDLIPAHGKEILRRFHPTVEQLAQLAVVTPNAHLVFGELGFKTGLAHLYNIPGVSAVKKGDLVTAGNGQRRCLILTTPEKRGESFDAFFYIEE